MGAWKETEPGQATQTDPRDIPDHMVLCSVDKLGEEGARGDICSDGICLVKLLSWRMGPRSSADG